MSQNTRREFLMRSLATTAGLALPESLTIASAKRTKEYSSKPVYRNPANTIRFAVIGMNHGHIYSQVAALIEGGGQLISCYAKEPELMAAFVKRYPAVKQARSEKEILEDSTIQMIVSAGIPADRAPLGIQTMRHGKDYLVDKPGIITLAQLDEVRRVQKETKRIYSIMYSERFENRATVKAGELVQAGAIGTVIQTIGLGPHRLNISSRPEWFFDKEKYGGILCDIASHQFDQFLFFTGSTQAEIISSQTGNVHHPNYPGLEDFGDAHVRGNGGTGYLRVDWFTPGGLNTWGDCRLIILGTDGYIEVRKNTDIGGRPGDNHLFLVDQKETRYIDCRGVLLPYGEQVVNDVVNRTETAMTQNHCFLATELALIAQRDAKNLKV
jgi:predicted dehydrogenase